MRQVFPSSGGQVPGCSEQRLHASVCTVFPHGARRGVSSHASWLFSTRNRLFVVPYLSAQGGGSPVKGLGFTIRQSAGPSMVSCPAFGLASHPCPSSRPTSTPATERLSLPLCKSEGTVCQKADHTTCSSSLWFGPVTKAASPRPHFSRRVSLRLRSPPA